MTQIFVVGEFTPDGNSIFGVFSSQELADEAIRAWVEKENRWHLEGFSNDPEFLDICLFLEAEDEPTLSFKTKWGSHEIGSYILELDQMRAHFTEENQAQ